MTPQIPHVLLLIIRYGVYFSFAWVAVYWRRWQKRRREAVAQNWPSAEGIILTGHVAPTPKTSCFTATLQYTYFVDEYRTGTYIHEFAREIDADEFVRQLNNQRIPIRYKQSNPDKSVLEQSVVEQHAQPAPTSADRNLIAYGATTYQPGPKAQVPNPGPAEG
jgi:hypothetical protein